MMRLNLLFTLVVFMLACAVVGTAHADYYVWQDGDSGVSLSFPDDWDVVNNQQPDDVITVMAPAGRGQAVCRMRVRDDGRFAVYPSRFYDDIQRINFSTAFWRDYVSGYANPVLYMVQDGAGLGRGFAGYAVAGFDSAVPGPYMHRKALIFASYYNELLYLLECSAHKDAFAQWKGLFLSVAGSVDFQKADHQLMSGNYRRFLMEPDLPLQENNGEHYVLYRPTE